MDGAQVAGPEPVQVAGPEPESEPAQVAAAQVAGPEPEPVQVAAAQVAGPEPEPAQVAAAQVAGPGPERDQDLSVMSDSSNAERDQNLSVMSDSAQSVIQGGIRLFGFQIGGRAAVVPAVTANPDPQLVEDDEDEFDDAGEGIGELEVSYDAGDVDAVSEVS